MTSIIRSTSFGAISSFPSKPNLSLDISIDPTLCDHDHDESPTSSHIEDITPTHLPAPPSPFPWTWTCHRCTHTYRFSAALNRCLSCSHRFCRSCVSEYDYDGWDEWTAYYHPTPPTSSSAFSPSSTSSFYANPTDPDLCCDPDSISPCSSACSTPGYSSASSSSSDEDSDSEPDSPSEQAWFSQKSAEIERNFSPTLADDDRLLMNYPEQEWGVGMDIMDLSMCGDERPLRVLNHDIDDDDAMEWVPKIKPRLLGVVTETPMEVDSEEEEEEDEESEDEGIWMSPSPPRHTSSPSPTPDTKNDLSVPKRSIVLPPWKPTGDVGDRDCEPSRLGYRSKEEAEAVEGELKRILERIVEERGKKYEAGMGKSGGSSGKSGSVLQGAGGLRRV